MLGLYILAVCLVGSGSVRITTIPSQGPFRRGQTVAFSCELESALSDPVTYTWRVKELVGGVKEYNTQSFNTSYESLRLLRYCWYICIITLNGTILGSAEKFVELHEFLQTDEPIARSFSLNQRMVLSINRSESLLAQSSSLAWYHNGTKLSSVGRISITNNEKSLTISNMTKSDAGKYEVKINSLGSDPEICDRNIMPMLENFAVYAPVTFLLQESNLPTYNPEDAILDYTLPAYEGSAHRIFVINNLIRANVAAVRNVTGVKVVLLKDVLKQESTAYSSSVSYDNVTTQSLKITYTKTDDIAGQYVHLAFSSYTYFNRTTCPSYYDYMEINNYNNIPIFILYWNIRSDEKVGIKRGGNPPRVYTNGCPIERDNEDISEDVLHLLSEFGIVPLGRAKMYAATSCQEVAKASSQNKAGHYWITDGTNTQQEYCNI